MNYTFGRVAAYCGLRLSYYITAALLGLVFLALIPTDHRTASPLYILLAVAVLPSILNAIFFSSKKEKKRENKLTFPLFCKKYRYNFSAYISMNIAYLLVFLLLAAWHFSYSMNENAPDIITHLPMLLAAISLLARILSVVGYQLYFHLFPLKAMH